jgi:hypothetical protein
MEEMDFFLVSSAGPPAVRVVDDTLHSSSCGCFFGDCLRGRLVDGRQDSQTRDPKTYPLHLLAAVK